MKPATEAAFDLTVVEINGEPMVYDLDLARVLELTRPREIRTLIKRCLKTGFLSDSDICCTVQQNTGKRGRPGTAFSLTETGALLIMTRSETQKAHIITRCIVNVFRDHARKTLPANENSLTAAKFAEMQQALLKLQCEMALLSAGHITTAQHERMQHDVARLAALEHAGSRFLTVNAARSDIYREFREVTCWGGRGQPWRLAPAGLIHAVGVILRGRDASIQRELKVLAAERQMRLPNVPIEPPPDLDVPPPKTQRH